MNFQSFSVTLYAITKSNSEKYYHKDGWTTPSKCQLCRTLTEASEVKKKLSGEVKIITLEVKEVK